MEQHRTFAVPAVAGEKERLLRIRCSPSKPEDAFASVQYRKHWFWIDDQDLDSKRTLSTVLFIFTLSSGEPTQNLPLLTIPTS